MRYNLYRYVYFWSHIYRFTWVYFNKVTIPKRFREDVAYWRENTVDAWNASAGWSGDSGPLRIFCGKYFFQSKTLSPDSGRIFECFKFGSGIIFPPGIPKTNWQQKILLFNNNTKFAPQLIPRPDGFPNRNLYFT